MSVIDVTPGRDGLENLRILKRRVAEFQLFKRAAGFFGSEKQIILGPYQQRS